MAEKTDPDEPRDALVSVRLSDEQLGFLQLLADAHVTSVAEELRRILTEAVERRTAAEEEPELTDTEQNVLDALRGKGHLNLADLIYATNLTSDALKPVLKNLITKKQVATYKRNLVPYYCTAK